MLVRLYGCNFWCSKTIPVPKAQGTLEKGSGKIVNKQTNKQIKEFAVRLWHLATSEKRNDTFKYWVVKTYKCFILKFSIQNFYKAILDLTALKWQQ